MHSRIQVISLKFTEIFQQKKIIFKFLFHFFSLTFILKLDEPFRNEEIFIISLFSKVFFCSFGWYFTPWIRILEVEILRIQRFHILCTVGLGWPCSDLEICICQDSKQGKAHDFNLIFQGFRQDYSDCFSVQRWTRILYRQVNSFSYPPPLQILAKTCQYVAAIFI